MTQYTPLLIDEVGLCLVMYWGAPKNQGDQVFLVPCRPRYCDDLCSDRNLTIILARNIPLKAGTEKTKKSKKWGQISIRFDR